MGRLYFSIVGALSMHYRSSSPTVLRATLLSIVLGCLFFATGCATLPSRFSKKPKPEPSPVVMPSDVPELPSDQRDRVPGVNPAPVLLPPVIQPTAYQEVASEEMPAPRVTETPAPGAEEAEYPLDMSTALALVAGHNPQVAFAQARIREGYANLEAANVLWLPTIQTG